MTIDLAKEFKRLAQDDSWPWHMMDDTGEITNVNGDFCCSNSTLPQAHFIAESPLARAELCLMVVDAMECPGYDIEYILSNENINPDDYHNVKARVQQATKEG